MNGATPGRGLPFSGRVWMLLLAAFVASRLPLIGGGYGSDNDSWRNIVAAIHMREAGRYIPSRVPGFPLYEGLLALLAPGGWIATNLASVVAELAVAILFARLLVRLRVRSPVWPWLALMFGEMFWVRATQTLDYSFGLAFFLACLLALLDRRHLLAGAMLAMAAGCRPTYGLVNLAVLAMLVARRAPWRAYGAYALTHGLLLILLFVPVLLGPEARGLSHHFTQHAGSHATLSTLIPIVRAGVVSLFGKWGTVVLALALLAAALRAVRGRGIHNDLAARSAEARDMLAFGLAATVAVGGFYLLIPGEGAYLLPLLPVLLIGLAAWLPRVWMIAVTLAVMAEALVSIKLDQRRIVPGALFEERSLRRQDLIDTRALLDRRPARPTVFVVGNFMVHRLLALDPTLERTEAGWSAFHHTGIGLRSRTRPIQFAEDLDAAQRAALEREGWTVRRLPYDER